MEGKDRQYYSSPEMLHVLNIQLINFVEYSADMFNLALIDYYIHVK